MYNIFPFLLGFTCYTCRDQECQDQKLTSCSSGSEYCMTTIQQDKDGKRIFTKGYVYQAVRLNHNTFKL